MEIVIEGKNLPSVKILLYGKYRNYGRFFSFRYDSGPEYPLIEMQIKSRGSHLGVFPENMLGCFIKKNKKLKVE